MSCELLLAPSFPILLERLLKELELSCQQDPLSPKWILLPTSTASNHLREKIAQRAGASALSGIRVIPLISFVRRLAGTMASPHIPRWGPALDLLLFEMVEELPASSPLLGLQRMPGGFHLLRPTFLDLADGGFGPDQVEILLELAEESDLTALEGETLRLYTRWIGLLQVRNLIWEPLLHQAVPEWIMQADVQTLNNSLACEVGQTPRLMLYGFYGFTDVNAQVVTALGRRVSLQLFYPYAEEEGQAHPAFFFCQAVLEELKVRMGTSLLSVFPASQGQELGPSGVDPTSFFLSTFPEGEVGRRPQFLTYQRASGIRAEVLSAAIRIRQWMDHAQDAFRPDQILVVAPDPAPYLDAVREIFAAFAIPLRRVDVPVRSSPESRPLEMLARIWEERGAAEWVLAYLREYPRIKAARGANVDRFERKVRQLGIWGDSSWRLILELDTYDSGPNRPQLPSFTRAEKALVEEILDMWVAGSKSAGSLGPEEAVVFIRKMAERWLEDASLLAPLLEALNSLQVARPDLPISPSLLRSLLLQTRGEQVQTDPPDLRGVILLPLMRARGLNSRGIVLLGLASGSWSSRVEEDPLFSDISRGRLIAKAREVGHLLPIKSLVTQEMSLLFFLLNSCAECIHWIIPKTDDSGRSVAPTPGVQRYLQHWEEPGAGEMPDTAIPRGPLQQAEYLLSLDPADGSFLPPQFGTLLKPEPAAAFHEEISHHYLLKAQGLRERDPSWNGLVSSAGLSASEVKERPRVQVTGLETLARCPYRFYAGRLMNWQPLLPLRLPDEMNALDWGRLVHKLLEQLISSHLKEGRTMGEISRAILASGEEELRNAIQNFPPSLRISLEVMPLPFRQAAVVRLVKLVQDYFETAKNDPLNQDIPIQLEVKKRVPFPGLEGVEISGQMDRIDQGEQTVHIRDYKSGAQGISTGRLLREVSLGYRIQPILYPWMFRLEDPRSREVHFSFVFLGDSPPKEREISCPPTVGEFLQPLRDILQRGTYLPTPQETLILQGIDGINPCQYCEYSSLCRRFDPLAGHRYFRLSRQWLSLRLASLSRPTGAGGDEPK